MLPSNAVFTFDWAELSNCCFFLPRRCTKSLCAKASAPSGSVTSSCSSCRPSSTSASWPRKRPQRRQPPILRPTKKLAKLKIGKKFGQLARKKSPKKSHKSHPIKHNVCPNVRPINDWITFSSIVSRNVLEKLDLFLDLCFVVVSDSIKVFLTFKVPNENL